LSELTLSAVDAKQTCLSRRSMSTFGGKADIGRSRCQLPLTRMTQSGQWVAAFAAMHDLWPAILQM